ncbi:MAG: hypothetical protein WD737_03305 [Gemmatimonadota bacterium]
MFDRKLAASAALLGIASLITSCGPRLAEVVNNGEVLPDRSAATIADARANGELERARLTEERLQAGTAALASCTPQVCEAIARGEVTIGMSFGQVLAATRTTADAWESRTSGGFTVLTVRPGSRAPDDAVGELAYVSLESGAVANYTYREPQGFRSVSDPADATLAGRAEARAAALLQQGDEYAAAGRLDLALDRYDRADVIRPGDSETTLRIAAALDKQLRPIEAILRYQLFIHQMELEKIEARGVVAANIAEAIARARERVIILEQQ